MPCRAGAGQVLHTPKFGGPNGPGHMGVHGPEVGGRTPMCELRGRCDGEHVLSPVAPGLPVSAHSVLDVVPQLPGQSAAAALRETAEVAQAADDLGYRRFWVGEQHGVRGVGSAAPAVLAAVLAARTDRIRLGAGGVLLTNHQPLVVAEQFAALAAAYPS